MRTTSHPLTVFLVLEAAFAVVATAQFGPGYVDPEPVLRAAEQATRSLI